MATFLFTLTPESGDAEHWKMFEALHTRFPRHEFCAFAAEDPSLENTIVPMLEDGDAGRSVERTSKIDHKLINEIELVFQDLVSKSIGWKPS